MSSFTHYKLNGTHKEPRRVFGSTGSKIWHTNTYRFTKTRAKSQGQQRWLPVMWTNTVILIYDVIISGRFARSAEELFITLENLLHVHTFNGQTAEDWNFLNMSDVQDLNLTFSGCGFLGIYHIGVMSCLEQKASSFLGRVKCFGGASAGAFAAVGLVMNLDISDIVESVLRLGKRANSLSLGPFHPSFQVVKTVRKAFDRMLPDNAHEIATGRLHISLSQVTLTGFKNVIISEFYSKEDLIEVS